MLRFSSSARCTARAASVLSSGQAHRGDGLRLYLSQQNPDLALAAAKIGATINAWVARADTANVPCLCPHPGVKGTVAIVATSARFYSASQLDGTHSPVFVEVVRNARDHGANGASFVAGWRKTPPGVSQILSAAVMMRRLQTRVWVAAQDMEWLGVTPRDDAVPLDVPFDQRPREFLHASQFAAGEALFASTPVICTGPGRCFIPVGRTRAALQGYADVNPPPPGVIPLYFPARVVATSPLLRLHERSLPIVAPEGDQWGPFNSTHAQFFPLTGMESTEAALAFASTSV